MAGSISEIGIMDPRVVKVENKGRTSNSEKVDSDTCMIETASKIQSDVVLEPFSYTMPMSCSSLAPCLHGIVVYVLFMPRRRAAQAP